MAKGNIESTPLWQDIRSVIESGPKIVKNNFTAMIHTENNDFTVNKIIEIEQMDDYVNNVTSSMHVRFFMGMGDYAYKLYPFRDNLEFSLKTINLTEANGQQPNAGIDVTRYKAVMNPNENPQPTGSKLANADINTLNQTNLIEVKLELQSRRFEPLRIKTISGGVYRSVTMKSLIASVLKGESDNILIDGKSPVDGVDLVDPDNKVAMKDAFVPNNLKISQLPTYLQEKSKGVYNAGLGTYFTKYKDKYLWFVYPLFNTKRFDEDIDRVVLFSVPDGKLTGIDRTFRKEGKILYIAVTGDKTYHDSGGLTAINQGVGFRMSDANAMMKKPVLMTDEGPKADRSRLNFEVASRKRADGLYYAPVVSGSANAFKMFSQLAGRELAKLDIGWEHSKADLIYPCMPCKYVFMDKDKYKERKGIICGKYTLTTLAGRVSTASTYMTSTHLSVMLEEFNDIPDNPRTPTAGTF